MDHGKVTPVMSETPATVVYVVVTARYQWFREVCATREGAQKWITKHTTAGKKAFKYEVIPCKVKR